MSNNVQILRHKRSHDCESGTRDCVRHIPPLNPNGALFYLTFLPQFIELGESVLRKCLLLLLPSIHVLMGACSHARARGAGLEALTGGVLVGFGLKLAFARR